MSADKSTKLEPIIKAGTSNITAWNHHLKDNILILGLTRIMSSDEASDLNGFSPDAEIPAGYIDIEAFQATQHARFPGTQ